jgi:tRNA (guanine-N7-)-methyltransferase
MRNDPYAHAPRLPDGGPIDPRRVFHPPDTDSFPIDVASPVELEIGPGRGWFTVERLAVDSGVRVVGLEIKRKWATIVDERLKKRGLGHRGRVFAEDAKSVLPRFVSESLSIVYLHFPDPWWKKRHQKRSVLNAELLAQLGRVLAPGGELFIQTDVWERAEAYEALVAQSPHFEPFFDQARVDDHPYGARSPRERTAISDGLPVARLRYRLTRPAR